MKKNILLLSALITLKLSSFSQEPWGIDSASSDKIEWSSYSTSFVGDIKDSVPFIVTAIPSETVEDMNMPLDLSFNGSLFRFKSALSDKTRKIYTTDSSAVYFLTPGIFRSNADRYEFRVTINAKTIIKPWGPVEAFSNLALNNFRKGFGYLGGYKTTWGNFIIVELRRKGTDSTLSSAVIYWKETKPAISAIYTTKNLNDFFKSLTRPWDKTILPKDVSKALILNPDENSVIFSIAGEVYKKQSLEYSLVRDGKNVIAWQANDFDNNFIWLQGLSYGNYIVRIRFAKQRQNVTEYSFRVRPAWHQTAAFKIIAILVTLVSLLSIVLLFRVVKQREKLKSEQRHRQNKEAELKALRAQLNPHFIFNSLSSIQGLINNHEVENANTYLADFAALMRSTLTANDKATHSLAEEIIVVEKYLRLEQMRFNFKYSIQVTNQINTTVTEIAPLLLQPLVENAVKHGISSLQEKGIIAIEITKQQKDMIISIADNGKGFVNTGPTNGYGLKLTKERITLIDDVSKTQSVSFEIKSGEATTVVLTFKNWL